MNLLEINHVEKSFGDLSVLKDISLSVSRGRDRVHHRTVRLG